MPKDEFTASALMRMKKDELLGLAKARKIKVDESFTKSDIVNRLMAKIDRTSPKRSKDSSGLKSSPGEKSKPVAGPNVLRTKPSKPSDTPIETSETMIEKSKFEISKPQDHLPPYQNKDSLYYHSEENHLVLLVQNPYWCFSYWSITEKSREEAKRFYGKQFPQAELTLRVYNESISRQQNRMIYFDIPVREDATSWYINIPKPEYRYYAEIGYKNLHRFYILCQSNHVTIPGVTLSKTPLDSIQTPAEVLDQAIFYPQAPQVMSEETSRQILDVMGGGGLKSGPSSVDIQNRLFPCVSSWATATALTGTGPFNHDSLAREPFWFNVECELTVRGQIQPGGKVIINNTQEMSLDENHCFRLQFPLKDGMIELKTMGISPDGTLSQTIRPIISKKTDIF
ncbi:MAG: DUF4912 domain-containing protein [Candidatus Delongbacteria bacterium]|nr:DUF4912 domain-containing protein [Candidatus Delongbacteria bacterium]